MHMPKSSPGAAQDMSPQYRHATRGPEAFVTSIVFVSLSAIALCLRLITRIRIIKSVYLEDYLTIVAFVFAVALTTLICEEVKYGMGRHFTALAPGEFQKSGKPFYASVPIYNASLSLTKIAILIQYYRIFAMPKTRKATVASLVFVTAAGLWAFFSTIFICTPVAYFWNKNIPGGHCLNFMAVWFTNASLNIVTDILLITIPIPSLLKLNVPKRQKVTLICIFALGGFGCVTSILRLHALYVISVSTDITWDNVGAATWSVVETNVCFICACLATLKPLVNKVFPQFASSATGGVRSSYQPPTPGAPPSDYFKRASRARTTEQDDDAEELHILDDVEKTGRSPSERSSEH